jgi:hypothetical protein
MAHYVFQVSNQSAYGKQRNAQEIFNYLVQERNAWGFGKHTPNRKVINKGDSVLFYITGTKNQTFVATAKLASGAYENTNKESKDWFLDPGTLRIDLEDVKIFDDPKSRFHFSSIHWRPAQGGSSKISEHDFNVIVGIEPDQIITEDDIANEEMAYALEKHLEDFIVENWSKIEFGEKLELYIDKNGNSGQQYYTEEVGYIDLLAKDKNGNFVVIELKKGRRDDEVVGQVLRYMGWVRMNLCKNSESVRGLIIVGERNPKLKYALTETGNNISAMVYQVKFQLHNY